MQNYNLKSKINFCFLVIIFSFALFALHLSEANAARLYFERSENVINEGDTFEVTLMLDPQEDEINAVEGDISFSDNLELKNINDGSSLLTLWIERPIAKDKSIVFSGITPGGYLGELSPYWDGYHPGKILTLTLKTTKAGFSWLQMDNITVLLNDGEGTQISPTIENMQFIVADTKRDKAILKKADLYSDDELPEIFTPQIAQDENIFDGKFFLIFETQDKGSGILFYEVKEGKREFLNAESPYLLEDQSLKSFIQIKAVDRSGNVRIADIEPTYPPIIYKNYTFWIIIILIVIIIWRFRRKK